MVQPSRGYEILGFFKHPFEHGEAENEPNAPEYYLKPPYFTDILGDSKSQKSWIIFGDFGTGKSALRGSIESAIRGDPADQIVCITYDDFTEILTNKSFREVRLSDHVDQILTRTTLALLALVAKRKEQIKEGQIKLDKSKREEIRYFGTRYFRSLSSAEADKYVSSVSTIDDKTRKLIQEHKATLMNLIVNVGLAFLFGSQGLKPPQVNLDFPSEANQGGGVDNPVFLLQRTYELFKVFGVGTIILLLDRLDQTGQDKNGEDLNNPDNIVQFLSPLMTHTNLLELKESTCACPLW